MAVLITALPIQVQAAQFDAPYYALGKKNKAMFYDFPGAEEYKKRTGIDLSEAAFVGRKGQGRNPVGGIAGRLGPNRQEAFEAESIKQITAYIKQKAKVDKVNAQASEMAAHIKDRGRP